MKKWQFKLHEVIFEADTKSGKYFDILLIIFIALSIMVIMLDSVKSLNLLYGDLFYRLEWFFTLLFTIEYILRLISFKTMRSYAFSFFGIIDLLSILPTFLSLIIPGSQYFLTIRFLRVLRVFRVLKLVRFVSEANILMRSLKRSGRKIFVFILSVITLVTIFGSIMYVIEDPKNGFTSIPKSMYWAIVTLTTVGYGDIAPQTNIGQAISAVIMILGYGIIAVPTGIVTAEMTQALKNTNTQVCNNCNESHHDDNAIFCKICGNSLNKEIQ
jgi:voltage-gated potassium channel